MNDPVEEFLQQPPALPVDAVQKEAVFQQTAAMLHRRRGWRRPVAVAAAAAIAVALIASLYWLATTENPPRPKGELVEHKPAPVPNRPVEPLAPQPQLIPVAAHPRELEWKAFDAADDQERVRLYFQAGDLFLAAHNDVDSALRCYHQAFHYCEARELEITANDNWLVMALKRDQRKEK